MKFTGLRKLIDDHEAAYLAFIRSPVNTSGMESPVYQRLVDTRNAILDGSLWRPIDTAPRDGTDILLFFPHLGDRHSPSGIIEGSWFSSSKKTDDGWDTMIGSIGEPTHWMPLLTPPKGDDTTKRPKPR